MIPLLLAAKSGGEVGKRGSNVGHDIPFMVMTLPRMVTCAVVVVVVVVVVAFMDCSVGVEGWQGFMIGSCKLFS